MAKLTGLALFEQDIKWIFRQFIEPPLVSISLQTECRRVDGNIIETEIETIYLYGDYEIVIRRRNGLFVSVEHTQTRKCLIFDDRINSSQGLTVAKSLIKKNKAILEGKS
jgi:hypothetical protein